jgi:hypothetical protein
MTSHRTVKLFAALIGASAVLTLGALNTTILAQHDTYDLAKGTTMSTGATSTETTPPTVPAVAQAVPGIKGPAPLPSEQQAAK